MQSLQMSVDTLVGSLSPKGEQFESRNESEKWIQECLSSRLACHSFPVGAALNSLLLLDEVVEVTQVFPDSHQPRNWLIFMNELILVEASARLSVESEMEGNLNEKQPVRNQFRIGNVKSSTRRNTIQFSVHENTYRLSPNNIRAFYFAAMIDEINTAVGQNDLFKRSVVLVKAWCAFEARRFSHQDITAVFTHEVITVLVVNIFATQDEKIPISHPLDVLSSFLKMFSDVNCNWTDRTFRATKVTARGAGAADEQTPTKSTSLQQQDSKTNVGNESLLHTAFSVIISKYSQRFHKKLAKVQSSSVGRGGGRGDLSASLSPSSSGHNIHALSSVISGATTTCADSTCSGTADTTNKNDGDVSCGRKRDILVVLDPVTGKNLLPRTNSDDDETNAVDFVALSEAFKQGHAEFVSCLESLRATANAANGADDADVRDGSAEERDAPTAAAAEAVQKLLFPLTYAAVRSYRRVKKITLSAASADGSTAASTSAAAAVTVDPVNTAAVSSDGFILNYTLPDICDIISYSEVTLAVSQKGATPAVNNIFRSAAGPAGASAWGVGPAASVASGHGRGGQSHLLTHNNHNVPPLSPPSMDGSGSINNRVRTNSFGNGSVVSIASGGSNGSYHTAESLARASRGLSPTALPFPHHHQQQQKQYQAGGSVPGSYNISPPSPVVAGGMHGMGGMPGTGPYYPDGHMTNNVHSGRGQYNYPHKGATHTPDTLIRPSGHMKSVYPIPTPLSHPPPERPRPMFENKRYIGKDTYAKNSRAAILAQQEKEAERVRLLEEQQQQKEQEQKYWEEQQQLQIQQQRQMMAQQMSSNQHHRYEHHQQNPLPPQQQQQSSSSSLLPESFTLSDFYGINNDHSANSVHSTHSVHSGSARSGGPPSQSLSPLSGSLSGLALGGLLGSGGGGKQSSKGSYLDCGSEFDLWQPSQSSMGYDQNSSSLFGNASGALDSDNSSKGSVLSGDRGGAHKQHQQQSEGGPETSKMDWFNNYLSK